jgi:hypothetical protein
MRAAMAAARIANGAASRVIAMAAFMRSGYAIRARAILRKMRTLSRSRPVLFGRAPANEHRRWVTLL